MSKMELTVKLLFLLAALWAVGVGTILLLRPVEVHSVAAVSSDGALQQPPPERDIEYRSWYEVQGAWGVGVLVVFALVYGGAALLVWRSHHIAGVSSALAAVLMTGLAGFSIGPAYAPAALGVLIGSGALGARSLLRHPRPS